MNRRDFIKNSLLALGCSGIACSAKMLYDFNGETNVGSGVFLTKKDLEQKFLNKSELPKKIKLEACTLCQLNCVGCFMRLCPDKVKNGCGLGYLKFKDFKKLVDENDIEAIELSNNGEIFLNPELLEIIKYADKKGICLTAYIGVNLNYLTDEMAEALVKHKFNHLTVSIDGATPKTYAIYRRGGDFNTVIGNIKKINHYKKKYKSEFPDLTYKFILFGHNEHEIDKAKLLAKQLNMHIQFSSNFYEGYSPVKNVELVKEKTGVDTSMLLDKERAVLYNKDHSKWWFCKDLWTYPQINWDGKILGCCRDFDKNFGGNAFKDGLLKAFNHPKMIYAKNMIANNAPPVDGVPCSTCNIYQTIQLMNMDLKPADKQGTKWL